MNHQWKQTLAVGVSAFGALSMEVFGIRNRINALRSKITLFLWQRTQRQESLYCKW